MWCFLENKTIEWSCVKLTLCNFLPVVLLCRENTQRVLTKKLKKPHHEQDFATSQTHHRTVASLCVPRLRRASRYVTKRHGHGTSQVNEGCGEIVFWRFESYPYHHLPLTRNTCFVRGQGVCFAGPVLCQTEI